MATMKKDASVRREEGKKMYRGIFHYTEVPGGTLKFPLRVHKGDPIRTYELVDDQEYSLPKDVIKHLNSDSGRYLVYEYVDDSKGKPEMRVGRKVARYTFEVTDFFDPEDVAAPELFVVEKSI